MIAGQFITPTLRLVRPLGQGAMGSVWVADHISIDTRVAVKFMTASAAQDAELVARFRSEAAAAAQIKSPHVAQVLDHGVSIDGTLYIVMELLEGEDLKSRLTRRGPLPTREVALIIRQTAHALGRAHQHGIVHRDIKPENLFLLDVDGEPFVKVLDFGIAKQSRNPGLSMTETGSLLGTPYYMSPEQLLSAKHVDAHADLWALAIVAYQSLTGTIPFTGETLGALAVAVNSGCPPLPSQLRKDLPPAVDAWVARALHRVPVNRFSSAKEMADALEQALKESTPNETATTDTVREDLAIAGSQAMTLRELSESGTLSRSRSRIIISAIIVTCFCLIGGLLLLTKRSGHYDGDADRSVDNAKPLQAGAATIQASASASANVNAGQPSSTAIFNDPTPPSIMSARSSPEISPTPASSREDRSGPVPKHTPTKRTGSAPKDNDDDVGF